MVENPEIIIDVRTREEFVKEHVEGAINIPHYDVKYYANILKGKKLKVYCNTGARAALCMTKIKAMGMDAEVISPDDVDLMDKEGKDIICAVNFVSVRPGDEDLFLGGMMDICRTTEAMDGYLGSKVLEVSGVSAAGSLLPEYCSDLEITPRKYIILTYWESKEAHEKSHDLPEFFDRYNSLPKYLTQMPYEEFYEILK
jgi:rhodanese-related sulfurtransferase